MDDSGKAAGLFVAVGEHGLRMVSANGADWKHAQTGKDGEIYCSVCHGKGRFVALGTYGGSNIFATTRDGQKWETSTKTSRTGNVRGVGFGKDLFLAVGGDAGFGSYALPCATESADGTTWSDFHSFPGKSILRRVAFGNDRFVGVGDSGRRAASPDGKDWKDAAEIKAVDTLIDLVFAKGIFVGVGLHGLRMRSEDGLRWTDRQVGEEGEHLNSIVWTGDRFAAVGLGATYFSADGQQWQRQQNKNAPLTAASGAGVFVGAHWKGRILVSKDAVAWEQAFKADDHVEAITYGP